MNSRMPTNISTMFQYLSEHADDLVAVKTSGKLDKDDLDRLLPEIEQKIKQFGKISFFWEMDAFEGWTPVSFAQDRAFDLKHATDFRKIAIVGEKGWEEKLAGVMKFFTSSQLKYFDVTQRQQALNWARES
jgi:SpoIIAA-like